jgi:hypothetical protein
MGAPGTAMDRGLDDHGLGNTHLSHELGHHLRGSTVSPLNNDCAWPGDLEAVMANFNRHEDRDFSIVTCTDILGWSMHTATIAGFRAVVNKNRPRVWPRTTAATPPAGRVTGGRHGIEFVKSDRYPRIGPALAMGGWMRGRYHEAQSIATSLRHRSWRDTDRRLVYASPLRGDFEGSLRQKVTIATKSVERGKHTPLRDSALPASARKRRFSVTSSHGCHRPYQVHWPTRDADCGDRADAGRPRREGKIRAIGVVPSPSQMRLGRTPSSTSQPPYTL